MAASPQRGTPHRPAAAPGRSTFDLQLTPLLLVGFITGILSTVALGVTAVIAEPNGPPPGAQQSGQAPPPPHPSLAPVIVSAAVFVVAWVTVVIALARDHLARRMASITDQAASDRDEAHAELLARLTTLGEAGEQRETEYYINGMKAAESSDGQATIHPIRTVPPPRQD